MDFQWLEMRIAEESERRQKEAVILERLPHVLKELHDALAACIASYTASFGAESAEMALQSSRIHIVTREEEDGKWRQTAKVDITAVPSIPGFQIERGNSEPLIVEIGILPGDKAYYRDRQLDKYLGMDELTRRILDRALFPRLTE